MLKLTLAFAAALCAPMLAQAKPTVGQPLAPIVLSGDDQGLMVLGKDISYKTLDTAKFIPGKVRAVVHMAGRGSAKKMGKKFIDALAAAKLPKDSFQCLTIMNTDDAMFGTAGMAQGKLEDRKKEKPYYAYAIDEDGKARKAWGLREESFAVAITNKKGQVVFFTEGKIGGAVASAMMTMIKAEIAKP